VKLTDHAGPGRLALLGLALAASFACNRNDQLPADEPAGESVLASRSIRSRAILREVLNASPQEAAAPAPPAAPVPPAAPAPSVLAASLLGARELPAFRALSADRLQLVALDRAGRPGKPFGIDRARLDAATFARRVKPLLPPGRLATGETLVCDDQQRTCVLEHAAGSATTYLFSAAPARALLREIRTRPAAGGMHAR
jgi:hypothetical protein